MRVVLLYGLGVPVLLALLLALALPTRRPLAFLGRGLRALVTELGGRAVLAVGAAILAVNVLQSLLDPALTASLGYTWTGWIAELEGDLVARVQATLPEWLVLPLDLFYLIGYVAFLALPPLVWHAHPPRVAPREPPPTATYLAGFAANYALALPFYLFAPVVEPGWSGLSAAEPLLERLGSGITEELRMASALDNCLPSLHVSALVTALVLVRHSGPRRLVTLLWMATLATTYTVLALGVHWVTDVVVAVPFGLLCAWVGRRATRRLGN